MMEFFNQGCEKCGGADLLDSLFADVQTSHDSLVEGIYKVLQLFHFQMRGLVSLSQIPIETNALY